MSMDFGKRVDACFYYLESGHDADGTVDYMMKKFADDDTLRRAKHPRKLCLNIITMGGTGDQKQMNMAAYQQALTRFIQKETRRQVQEMESENKRLRNKLDEAHDREVDHLSTIQRQQEELHNSKAEAASRRIQALEEAVRAA